MSLTKQDKQDIQEIISANINVAVTELAGIINDLASNMDKRFEQVDKRFEQVDKRFEQVDKRFEQVDKRFDRLEDKVGSLEQEQRITNQRLTSLESRLEALENDIKDIYLMLAAKQDKKVLPKHLKGKDLEQYVIETYVNLKQIAKESHIKLPE
jgi:septal ring factor EnvC (AmiA/AmiB activator)